MASMAVRQGNTTIAGAGQKFPGLGVKSGNRFLGMTSTEDRGRMKRSKLRLAPLFCLCAALAVAPRSGAENLVRKFIPLAPKDPAIPARIDARRAESARTGQSVQANRPINAPSMESTKHLVSRSVPSATAPNAVKAASGNSIASSHDANGTRRVSPFPALSTAQTPAPGSTFGGFLNGEVYPISLLPNDYGVASVLTSDLNNDGHPDLVTLSLSGNLYVQLNDGKGGLQPAIANSGGKSFTSGADLLTYITAADVNHDQLADLVVTQWGGYSNTAGAPPRMLVFLNQGNGNFASPIPMEMNFGKNERPGAVIVSDQDNDGNPDLTVVSYQEVDEAWSTDGLNTPSVYHTNVNTQTFFGGGDGTFKSSGQVSTYDYDGYSVIVPNGGAQIVTLGGTPYLAVEAVAYGWNYDWNYYINQLTSQGASVFFFPLSTGGRSAPPVSNIPFNEVRVGSVYNLQPDYVNGLSLADVNGDGIPDITLNFSDGLLYGALGTSDGKFAAPRIVASQVMEYFPDYWAQDWALTDVNGDGFPDMVARNFFDVAVWLGKGDGTFADPKEFNTNEFDGYVNSMAVADFDGDGKADIASTIWDGNAACIFKGFGDGTFAAPKSVGAPNGSPTTQNGVRSVVADLNGDGLSDIVVTNLNLGGLATAISDGKGHFTWNSQALSRNPGGFYYLEADFGGAGDFNQDGRADMLLQGSVTGGFAFGVASSNGDGTFADPIIFNRPMPEAARSTILADVNHDGKLDIVNTYCAMWSWGDPTGVAVALGNGDGTFQQTPFIPFGDCPGSVIAADVNEDGNLDLVVADDVQVDVLLGDGTGSFNAAAPIVVADGLSPVTVRSLDVNNDGHVDIAILSDSQTTFTRNIPIYAGSGHGTFTLVNTIEVPSGYAGDDIIAADFNGDGCADLMGVYLSLGKCDGTFQDPQFQFVPSGAIGDFKLATFTKDGLSSVVARNTLNEAPTYILYNVAGTQTLLNASQNSITQGNTVTLTASVRATWEHRPLPTGSVSFYDNGALLGTSSILAGVATYSTSDLAIGAHAITATYSGEANFNPGHSGTVNVTVAAAPPVSTPPDIAISSTVPNIVLKRGESTSAVLTLVGSATYNGNVSFTVSGAQGGLGISVNPASIALANGAPVKVSVNVTSIEGSASAMANSTGRWFGPAFGATALGLCFFGFSPRRRKSILARLCLALCALGLCLAQTACGSSSGSQHYARPGTSTIVLTATPSVPGVSARTTTFTVTVQ